jgi:hypothetical protein
MIPALFATVFGSASVFGFVRSIKREEGTRATVIEWCLSAAIGLMVAAGTYSLLK